jgi:hypothetical protein
MLDRERGRPSSRFDPSSYLTGAELVIHDADANLREPVSQIIGQEELAK